MRKAKIINMEHLNKKNTDVEFDPYNTAIGIIKSEKYLQLVQNMSDFINTLEMPLSEKERLINKLVEYDQAVRIDAMVQTLLKNIYAEEIEK